MVALALDGLQIGGGLQPDQLPEVVDQVCLVEVAVRRAEAREFAVRAEREEREREEVAREL